MKEGMKERQTADVNVLKGRIRLHSGMKSQITRVEVVFVFVGKTKEHQDRTRTMIRIHESDSYLLVLVVRIFDLNLSFHCTQSDRSDTTRISVVLS